MPQRYLVVPQIGEVVLSKRRGNRRIRLSINAAGQIRVGMPPWAPYEAGLLFVKRHKAWLQRQLLMHTPKPLIDGSQIGKMHRLTLIKVPAKNGSVQVSVSQNNILVKTDLGLENPLVQKKAIGVCEKALKREAETLLPQRIARISRKYNLPYRRLRIRKLTSRWGSCSSKKDITLSYFLIQLPWELIDYVILHELAHTVFPDHSRNFWSFMEDKLPNIGDLKRQIKVYRPRVESH